MKLKFEKNMRIVTDVMGYCFLLGARSFHMDLNVDVKVSAIEIDAGIPDMPPDKVDELRRILNTPRQYELEQNYWNLAGGEEVDGELLLAGVMVDEADVEYRNGVLYITMRRFHHSSQE